MNQADLIDRLYGLNERLATCDGPLGTIDDVQYEVRDAIVARLAFLDEPADSIEHFAALVQDRIAALVRALEERSLPSERLEAVTDELASLEQDVQAIVDAAAHRIDRSWEIPDNEGPMPGSGD